MPRATKGPVRARDKEQANIAGSDGSAASADPNAATSPETSSSVRPKRYRGSRGGRRHRGSGSASATSPPPAPVAAPEEEPKPKRRRGSRGGRKHRRSSSVKGDVEQATPAAAPPISEAPPQERRAAGNGPEKAVPAAPARAGGAGRGSRNNGTAPAAAQQRRQPTRNRRSQTATQAPAAASRSRVVSARARIPVTGAPTENVPAPFAHNAEYELARILDFYGIDWQYEPRTFPLRWERGHVTEAFTPDFYLPELNLYVELTTLKSSLTAEKNRKMRLLKELYPEVNVIMLKKRDYLRLVAKYGYGPLSPGQVPDIDRVLITASKIQQRVGQLGAQISRDYAGKEPVLIGVLRGVICFISDLMRHISVPSAVDLMAISSYEGNGAGAVRILKDIDENIKGRDVILVEDIVDTGMTLNHVIDYLQTKRPASIRVCTLLDKRARRIVNVPLDYVAFEIPDEFVVGYVLDFHQRFRNLPFIAVLKHELLP